MLEIRNYNNFILKDISFFLNNDENLLILGENGAGKSTLAKVLSNLIANDNVKIFEENLSKISNQKRVEYINYIPPKFEIFDEFMTVLEFLQISFIDNIDENKLKEVLNLLKLDKFIKKSCKNLSSGEKQLLLIASAILHNAKITIFDELTANLDINRIKDIFNILNSNLLNQKIIITHNLDFAFALKYKVLFLKDGKIEFYGTNKEFFEDTNLEKIYNKTIKKVQNHIVVDL
ncbi:ATP-binding cassette domain-containing protein [Aliarcobacter lanthieri]|uniref:ATP-binding cassette domain-containing protein n=1 Tax=Aliarcobacter lanthieri TaxID=1355374 RepID=UPI00047BFDA3|nr:ABC transporter ATP-binding protein [Aliarcobacter lanthieri]QKF59320.1 iron siderophore ABC transporter, ATP-binding protein [Aliarcobacter lanthieri]